MKNQLETIPNLRITMTNTCLTAVYMVVLIVFSTTLYKIKQTIQTIIYRNLCSHTGKQTQNKKISIGNVLVRHITVVKRHNYSLKIDGLSRHEPKNFSIFKRTHVMEDLGATQMRTGRMVCYIFFVNCCCSHIVALLLVKNLTCMLYTQCIMQCCFC